MSAGMPQDWKSQRPLKSAASRQSKNVHGKVRPFQHPPRRRKDEKEREVTFYGKDISVTLPQNANTDIPAHELSWTELCRLAESAGFL